MEFNWYKMFENAAKTRTNNYFTDEELHNQITSLTVLVDYFQARGDSNIILTQLRLELDSFKRMHEGRQRQ